MENVLANQHTAPAEPAERPLTDAELQLMHAYWRACNYLAVGMIYLKTTRC